MKKHFLNTMIGSWLKVFLTTVLSLYLATGKGLFDMDFESIKNLVSAGFASLIPVIINSLNPNDPRYGKNKEI
jgi:hypothetical protein